MEASPRRSNSSDCRARSCRSLIPAPHLTWEDGPLAEVEADDEEEIPEITLDDDAGLADRLWAARESAEAVKQADGRSRAALYRALAMAYDFAVAAGRVPEDYAELLDDAGVKAQARAPMTPIVKLVFGIDYDKTRLTEFAAALSNAERCAVRFRRLLSLPRRPGGRPQGARRRRAQGAPPRAQARQGGDAARDALRAAPAMALGRSPTNEEFALVVAAPQRRRRLRGRRLGQRRRRCSTAPCAAPRPEQTSLPLIVATGARRSIARAPTTTSRNMQNLWRPNGSWTKSLADSLRRPCRATPCPAKRRLRCRSGEAAAEFVVEVALMRKPGELAIRMNRSAAKPASAACGSPSSTTTCRSWSTASPPPSPRADWHPSPAAPGPQVPRDDKGKLDRSARASAESIIYIELDRADARRRQELVEELSTCSPTSAMRSPTGGRCSPTWTPTPPRSTRDDRRRGAAALARREPFHFARPCRGRPPTGKMRQCARHPARRWTAVGRAGVQGRDRPFDRTESPAADPQGRSRLAGPSPGAARRRHRPPRRTAASRSIAACGPAPRCASRPRRCRCCAAGWRRSTASSASPSSHGGKALRHAISTLPHDLLISFDEHEVREAGADRHVARRPAAADAAAAARAPSAPSLRLRLDPARGADDLAAHGDRDDARRCSRRAGQQLVGRAWRRRAGADALHACRSTRRRRMPDVDAAGRRAGRDGARLGAGGRRRAGRRGRARRARRACR